MGKLAKPVLGLVAPSVKELEVLGVWSHRRDYAAPPQVMRIADDDEHPGSPTKKAGRCASAGESCACLVHADIG